MRSSNCHHTSVTTCRASRGIGLATDFTYETVAVCWTAHKYKLSLPRTVGSACTWMHCCCCCPLVKAPCTLSHSVQVKQYKHTTTSTLNIVCKPAWHAQCQWEARKCALTSSKACLLHHGLLSVLTMNTYNMFVSTFLPLRQFKT